MLNKNVLVWVSIAFFNSHAHCVLRHAKMVGKFRLQDYAKLVDFCPCRLVSIGNSTACSELAKLESSNKNPVEALRYE